MRNLIYILFVIGNLTLFTSCEKVEVTPEEKAGIIGIWELRRESGGWSGPQTYSAENGHRYTFTSNHYQYYHNAQLIRKGQYQIIQDTVHILNEIKSKLVFDHEVGKPTIYIVALTSKELILGIDAYDAPVMTFEKIRK